MIYQPLIQVNKPSIVSVVGQRVLLRRSGKEYRGLCPFHSEKTPSFYVNEEKGRYHCFGCQASGDVIDFVMRTEGLSFPETTRALGIASQRRVKPALTVARKRAAELASKWVNEQRAKLNVLIAERYEQRDLADEIGDFQQAEMFDRELVMLRGFYDALGYPRGAAETLASRTAIEEITDRTPVKL